MGMEISRNYSSYASIDVKQTNNKKNVEKETAAAGSDKKMTTKEYLAALEEKFSDYSFAARDYHQGMKYGSEGTVNVAISPGFLSKMAKDPKLASKYEQEIAGMKESGEWAEKTLLGAGLRTIAQGWVIDKDGGISCWGIVEGVDKRSQSPKQYFTKEKLEDIKKAKKEKNEELQKKVEMKKEELEQDKSTTFFGSINAQKENETINIII